MFYMDKGGRLMKRSVDVTQEEVDDLALEEPCTQVIPAKKPSFDADAIMRVLRNQSGLVPNNNPV